MTNVLRGKDYHMISINNVRTKDETIEGIILKLHIPGTKAVFMTPGHEQELVIESGMIQLPPIMDGGMIYIK